MHSLKNDIVLNCVDEAHVFSVKVVGVTTGQLVNWKEDKNTGLLTVRSQDLLYINEINENTHNLIRVKIGVKLSDDDSKDISIGFSTVVVEGSPVMISISRNGAVYPIRIHKNEIGCVSLTPQRLIGYLCFLCLG